MVERATGGHVEIGSFSYNWRDLTAEVKSFVLRGTEPASAPPLFRADKIQIGFRIISALEKKVDIAVADRRKSARVHHHWPGRIDQYPEAEDCALQPERCRRSSRSPRAAYRTPSRYGGIQFLARSRWMPSASTCKCRWPIKLARSPPGRATCAPFLPRSCASPLQSCVLPLNSRWIPRWSLGRNTIQVLRMDLASGGMKIEAKGNIVDLYSPNADLDVTAALPVQDLNRLVQTPLEPRGDLWFQGRATAGGSDPDRFIGKLTGRSLGYSQKGIEIRGISRSVRTRISHPTKLRCGISMFPRPMAASTEISRSTNTSM